MKIDKEMVLKHKFWVVLLVSLPLTLGALFLLVTAVSGDINQKRTTIENDQKRYIKTKPDIKTPAEIAKARQEADIEKAKEKVVWEMAWQKQAPLFTWPRRVENEFNFQSGLFAQQIKIKRGEAVAEMPKDQDRLVHGTVLPRESENYIEVTGQDKRKYKFFRSMSVSRNPVEGDPAAKEIPFEQITGGDRVTVAYHVGKYFSEPLTDAEIERYAALDVYHSQIDALLAQVDPMTEKGEGILQLGGGATGGWYYKKGELPPPNPDQRFLIFLDKGFQNAQGDISEEAWLAQENLWVQYELYRIIAEANKSVSHFMGTGGEDKNKEYTFRNPGTFLEIGVKWSGGSKPDLTLKNLHDRRQRLELKFRVRFNKNLPPEEILIEGEPLGPHETRSKIPYDLKGDLPRTGIYGIDQVLTWETAAVKRIDQVSIGSQAPDEFSQSHRTYPDGQKNLKNEPPLPAGAVVAPPPDANLNLPIRPSGPSRLRGDPRKLKKKKDDAGPGDNELTGRNLIKNHYLEVTPQSRRIPVSIALIVDQEHIDRVQTAFNNSKLRFLTTQVSINRYPGSVRPVLPADEPTVQLGPPTAFRRFTSRPQPDPASSTTADDMETNIEMVIWGIVTLYERYPPPITAVVAAAPAPVPAVPAPAPAPK